MISQAWNNTWVEFKDYYASFKDQLVGMTPKYLLRELLKSPDFDVRGFKRYYVSELGKYYKFVDGEDELVMPKADAKDNKEALADIC